MHWKTSVYHGKGEQEELERENKEQRRDSVWGAKPVLMTYVPDRNLHTNSTHLSQSCSCIFTNLSAISNQLTFLDPLNILGLFLLTCDTLIPDVYLIFWI